MSSVVRELSGFFLSDEKFQQHCDALADPACTTTALRLYHNEPHHTVAVLRALMAAVAPNQSVSALELYQVQDAATATLLATYLSSTEALKAFSVQLLESAAVVEHLCIGLSANRTLSQLQLCQLDAHGVARLSAALAQWPAPARLQRLQLSRCQISAAAGGALAAALGQQAGALVRLELVDCSGGDEGMAALLGAPGFAELQQLEHLELSRCQLGAAGAKHLSAHLASSCRKLCTLALAGNRLGDAGVQELQAALAANASVNQLDLSENGVGLAGAQALAAALQSNSTLQELVLSHNAVGITGLLALLRATLGFGAADAPPQPSQSTLRALVADHNSIRGSELAAQGLQAAAGAAARLERLVLHNNSLYDAGVAMVARALAHDTALRQLDLRENGVGDAGAEALLPLLCAHPCLEGLLLEGNRIHNAGAKALLDAVLVREALWCFRIDNNKITDPALRATLSELSLARAARHSQEAVLGRRYSSDEGDAQLPERGPPRRQRAAGSVTSQTAGAAQPIADAAAAAASADGQQQYQSLQQSKHRLDEADPSMDVDGVGNGRGSAGRNVAARSSAEYGSSGSPAPYGAGGVVPQADGGWDAFSGGSMLQGGASSLPMDIDGGGAPTSDGAAATAASWQLCLANSTRSAGSSCDGNSLADAAASMMSYSSIGSSGWPNSQATAACYVTASATGAGGEADKRWTGCVSGSSSGSHRGGSMTRRTRYKPLTPEQQALFADF